MMWKLIVHHGHKEIVIHLNEGYSYTVGRAPNNQIYISHPTVSRTHARLTVEEDLVELEDLGSKNGTYVHGKKVDKIVIRTTTIIKFGNIHVTLRKVAKTGGEEETTESLPTTETENDAGLLFQHSDQLVYFWRDFVHLRGTFEQIRGIYKTAEEVLHGLFQKIQSLFPTVTVLALIEFKENNILHETVTAKEFERTDSGVRTYPQRPFYSVIAGRVDMQVDMEYIENARSHIHQSFIPHYYVLPNKNEIVIIVPLTITHVLYMRTHMTLVHNEGNFFRLQAFIMWSVDIWKRIRTEKGHENLAHIFPPYPFWGYSKKIYRLIKRATDAALSRDPVCIYGPPGSRQKDLAHWIHELSNRPGKWLTVDLSDPENPLFKIRQKNSRDEDNVFWPVHEGTIIIEHVDRLSEAELNWFVHWIQKPRIYHPQYHFPLALDIKWIFVLDKKPTEITSEKPYFHTFVLEVAPIMIEIPSLHERAEDIPFLVEALVVDKSKGKIKGALPETIRLFSLYPWLGNIEELEHVIHNAVNYALDIEDVSEGGAFLTEDHVKPFLHRDTSK